MIICARTTRGLSRASLDGRSRKPLTRLLCWALNWKREYEWMRVEEDQSAPIPEKITSGLGWINLKWRQRYAQSYIRDGL